MQLWLYKNTNKWLLDPSAPGDGPGWPAMPSMGVGVIMYKDNVKLWKDRIDATAADWYGERGEGVSDTNTGSGVSESVEKRWGWPAMSCEFCAGTCCGGECAGGVLGSVFGGAFAIAWRRQFYLQTVDGRVSANSGAGKYNITLYRTRCRWYSTVKSQKRGPHNQDTIVQP